MPIRGALKPREDEAAPPPSGDAIFARAVVYEAPGPELLAIWAALEAVAPCSIYQTRAWLLPWIETLGQKAGLRPFFIAALDDDGAPMALVCLGLHKAGPVTIASFLGGKDSNFNLPLKRPGLRWSGAVWRVLLREAAQQMGAAKPDAFLLLNQPAAWAGEPNGLTQLTAQPSPNAAFGTALIPNPDLLFARKLSRDTQKKLRKKKLRLAAIAPLSFACPARDPDKAAILDAFFAQKTARFRDQNIVSEFEDPAMRAFIEKASFNGPYGQGIELHALYCGSRIVAVYGGAGYRGHWSGMFNSFDSANEFARSSPGDLLLMNIMSEQCLAGAKHFDLGIGEARYKTMFCGNPIALFDSFLPVNHKGRVFLLIQALALRTKSGIKSHRGLYHLTRRLRAHFKRPATGL